MRGAVCRAIEHGRLTPYPDFGKATHSPCGHSKRAGHQGGLTATTLSLGSVSTAAKMKAIFAEHTSGRMEADGAIASRPLMFGGRNGNNRGDR